MFRYVCIYMYMVCMYVMHGMCMCTQVWLDLAAVRDQFPQLPIVEPAPAEVRARAALRAGANDGAWTPKLKATARSCFEAEAANIKTIVCIPEVVARDELLADPTFQVGPYPSPFHPSALSPAAGPSRPSHPEPPQCCT